MVLSSAEQVLVGLEGRARLLDPVNTMARGWSITRTASGEVLKSTAQATAGDTLVTVVADGTIASTVVGTENRNG